MRKLKTLDVFACARAIKKANIREELIPVFQDISKGNRDIEQIGINTILVIVESFGTAKAEEELYKFLSGPLEMDADAIKEMNLDEFIKVMKEFAEVNDLANFFDLVSNMTTTN